MNHDEETTIPSSTNGRIRFSDYFMTTEESKPKTTVRTCPHCKQEMTIQTGLHNWKNLFKMPSMEDWITLAIMALVILSYFAYQHDTKTCRDTLDNLDYICTMRNNADVVPIDKDTSSLPNLSRIDIIFENDSGGNG